MTRNNLKCHLKLSDFHATGPTKIHDVQVDNFVCILGLLLRHSRGGHSY